MVDNVQNCDSYINISSSKTCRSYLCLFLAKSSTIILNCKPQSRMKKIKEIVLLQESKTN
jgi:hypothetical protein